MVLAAAGLSSVEAADYCQSDSTFTEGSSMERQVTLWPPGLRCTYTQPGGRTASKDSGDAVGFIAILAAGLVLVVGRRSHLAFATAAVLGVAGLTQIPLGLVPASGFGWIVGGSIAYSRTRSVPAALIAVAALAVGGILELVGAGPAGWVITLLAVVALPQHEDNA
jgi:hypothetical protein